MRKIDEIILHCTATRPDWWKTRSSNQKVAEVRRWHVEERGWSDIGYHFLIDRNGTIVKGRPIERTGAHVKGHNKGTVGIALFGGHGGAQDDTFDEHYTMPQKRALVSLLNEIDPEGVMKVTGHNDYANKACPCFKVVDPRISEKPPKSSGGLGAIIAAILNALAKGVKK